LKAILAGLVEAQRAGGIKTTININGSSYHVTLKVPLALAIGDCEGNDKLCGRYGTHQLGNTLVCHDCNCPTLSSDLPDVVCQPLTTQIIADARFDKAALQSLSHHGIENAFHDVNFGGDAEGIHGCCPPEMLHLYQQGLYKYALESFMNFLTGQQRKALDQLISIISDCCCRQSDRTFPRFRFPRGVSNLTCFTASEQVGVALVCFFSLAMDDFRKLVFLKYNRSDGTWDTDEEGIPKCHEYRKLFEAMLVAEAWINKDSHSKEEVLHHAPAQITKFMHTYKTTVDRTDGHGLKIPKFHQLKHLPRYILKFGVPNNFSTARCESHHITLSKRPAKTAQKRDESFEKQVGERIIDSIVLNRATSSILSTIKALPPVTSDGSISGTRFTILKLEQSSDYCAIQCNAPYGTLPFPISLLNAFASEFEMYFPNHNGITCFTEHHRRDEHDTNYIFRGHPSYRGKPWHDWAYFRWCDDIEGSVTSGEHVNQSIISEIPGKIWFFLDARQMTTNEDYDPGLYAVVQSLEHSPVCVKGSNRSNILKVSRLTDTVSYSVCSTESIVDVAFVIPNIGGTNEHYVIDPPSDWSSYFIT
jgi:hypothetical protein